MLRAWFDADIGTFAALTPAEVAGRLAYAQAGRHAALELAQRHAWEATAALLHAALVGADPGWRVLLEVELLRLEQRIDAIVVTDRAILVLEVKAGARTFAAADLRQVDDYAMDLHDFHAGSRGWPIVPMLVATAAAAPSEPAVLLWQGVAPVQRAGAAGLRAGIAAIQAAIPAPPVPLDPVAWLAAPYRPVPNVLEAATLLYRRHGGAEIAAARADAKNLTRTTAAIDRAIAAARTERAHCVVFVTGIPGAGKTLCGLNVAFGALRSHGAAFLSGNVPLVAVLREALARDAAGAARGRARDIARRDARTALQNVHRFLEAHVLAPAQLPEARVIVFDEAQRAWDAKQATRDTQRRVSHLTMSEPAHALEIMGRHADGAVIVALIGNGQEINTGEAGLAEWGAVIAADARWRALAAPAVLTAAEPAQRLANGPMPWLALDPDLDLTVPIRQVRDAAGAAWVECVLAGDARAARTIADSAAALPFLLTRDLATLRATLRGLTRGWRRAGLVASAGAKRLRADGFGPQVADIAAWFLDRWPDVRSAEALETHATEYDCQGLELDLVGFAWGGDFLPGPEGWVARRFVGDRWQVVRGEAEQRFIRNTHRVLLTRARYETVIWVPRGSAPAAVEWHDPTRDAAAFDRLAAFLTACGARPAIPAAPPPLPAQALLL